MKTMDTKSGRVTARREQAFGVVTLALVLTIASTAQATITVSTFSSTNQLDLTGTFLYAEDIAELNPTPVVVGGVTFTAPTHFNLNPANYVNTSPGLADPNLDDIMTDWVFQPPAFTGTMSDAIVVPSSRYKLQLLFYDPFASSRGHWDITAEGQTLVNFDATTTTSPTVITFDNVFVTDGALNVSLAHNASTPSGDYETLAAFTVEEVPEPSSVAFLGLGGLLLARRFRSKA
jgi:hypothetical protein